MKRRYVCTEFTQWLMNNRTATEEEKVAKYNAMRQEIEAHNAIYATTPEGIEEQKQIEQRRQEIAAIEKERHEHKIAYIQELAKDEASRQWIAPLVMGGLIS